MLAVVAGTAVMALASGGAAHGQAPPGAADPRLRAFGSCDELLGHFKRRALEDLERFRHEVVSEVQEDSEVVGQASEPAKDFSETNVQEPSVDEPDIVKTDGQHVFALFNERVRAVAVRGNAPRLVGTLRIPRSYGGEMLLYGNRLLVMTYGGGSVLPVGSPKARRGGLITEVDVSNPARMRVVRTLAIDGFYVGARLHGSTARVVISSFDAWWYYPDDAYSGTLEQRQAAIDVARQRVQSSGLSDWIPFYTLRVTGHGRRSGLLVPCQEVLRSKDTQSMDFVSLLSIDLRRGLPQTDSDAVLMPYADVLYASPRNFYLASDQYGERDISTDLHKFDVTRRGQSQYRASGTVGGFLLNQFGLSEHRGFLRVATTERMFSTNNRSVSFVNVLAQRAGRLQRVGRVGNLGRGEAISAVRFLGDTGYVVTFRQIDPFYTIDLRYPTRPRVAGQLKLRGSSAYLHPIGNDLVLGVGQDATATGAALGTQVSLFDTANPRLPRRLARNALGLGTWSEVEWDHHAFLYWPARGLAVIPVEIYIAEDRDKPDLAGVVGFRVGRGSGVRDMGFVSHGATGSSGPVRRSIVVADRLITVSELGVESSMLDTFAQRGFARFPQVRRPAPSPG